MEAVITSVARVARQRTTAYDRPPKEQVARSYEAMALLPVVKTPAGQQYERVDQSDAR
jgi:hypothetical protein